MINTKDYFKKLVLNILNSRQDLSNSEKLEWKKDIEGLEELFSEYYTDEENKVSIGDIVNIELENGSTLRYAMLPIIPLNSEEMKILCLDDITVIPIGPNDIYFKFLDKFRVGTVYKDKFIFGDVARITEIEKFSSRAINGIEERVRSI